MFPRYYGSGTLYILSTQTFPLPGEYLFRAKKSYGKTHGKCYNLYKYTLQYSTFMNVYCNNAVWFDLTTKNEPLPMFSGKILLKVTRLAAATRSTPAAPIQTSATTNINKAPSAVQQPPKSSPTVAIQNPQKEQAAQLPPKPQAIAQPPTPAKTSDTIDLLGLNEAFSESTSSSYVTVDPFAMPVVTPPVAAPPKPKSNSMFDIENFSM